MHREVNFTRIRLQEDVITNKQDNGSSRMFDSFIACGALLTLWHLEKLHGRAPSGLSEKCSRLFIVTIRNNDDFEVLCDCLTLQTTKTLRENLAALMCGDDDGKSWHRGVLSTPVYNQMDTLFLDFCSHKKLLALVRDGATVAESALQDHTDEASVMPAIEDLVTKAGRTLHDIGRIAAVTGPGGFMSQRVGLAVANALAWSLKVPIGGVHLSEVYGARVSGDALWIHSTKKQLLFVRGLGKFAKTWPEPITITLDELSAIKKGSYVGEALPEQALVLNIKPLETMKDITAVLPSIVEHVSYDMKPLIPWYGRGA